MAPDVSVIIPTFDRAALLPRALASALSQIGPSLEVIVADDGSADATAEVLAGFSSDPRLRVLSLAHGGVCRARNAAVAEARAPLLAFLDSDDEWLPGKLEVQCALLRKTGLAICQTEEIWIRNGVRVNPPSHYVKRDGDLYDLSLRHCLITPSSVMMTRDLYANAGGFDPDFPACEDFEFWLRIVPYHQVGLIPKPYLVRYGGHADQLSTRYPAQDRFRIRAIALLLERNNLGPERRARALEALEEKLGIYEAGCRKRGNGEGLAWGAAIRTAIGGIATNGTGTIPGVTP
ncbi:MAG: glycosyltransferase family 2 protein [Fibrobacteres bacterium]|nr:glycosyltransferase family 2 protein [Fibrobacterota bacterium]